MEIPVDKLFHREHEVLVGPAHFSEWQRCQHGKQIAQCLAHWSDEAPFTVTKGQRNSTQSFPVTRHIDGTSVSDAFCYNTISRCAKCEALNSLDRRQEAYGDRVTCRECGDSYRPRSRGRLPERSFMTDGELGVDPANIHVLMPGPLGDLEVCSLDQLLLQLHSGTAWDDVLLDSSIESIDPGDREAIARVDRLNRTGDATAYWERS